MDWKCSEVFFLLSTVVPIIGFLFSIYRLKKFSGYELLKTSGFTLLALINYASFSFWELSNKYLIGIFIWILFAYLYPIYTKRKELSEHFIKIAVYAVILGFTIFNSVMSPIQRISFYTLGNPFTNNEISTTRLYDIAYLYNQNKENDKTYFLLNKCKNQLLLKIKDPNIDKSGRDNLIANYNLIEKSTILVMQDKWVKKEKLNL